MDWGKFFKRVRKGLRRFLRNTNAFLTAVVHGIVSAVKATISFFRTEWGKRTALCLLTAIAMFFIMRPQQVKAAPPEEIEEAEATVVVAPPEPVAVTTAVQTYDEEAEYVARVLYGTAQRCSREEQRAVTWLICNRVESPLYPSDVISVCRQDAQFMGYSDDNPVISELYDVAKEVLDTWRDGGHRDVLGDYLWMTWDNGRIILKTTFEDGKNTKYWTAR